MFERALRTGLGLLALAIACTESHQGARDDEAIGSAPRGELDAEAGSARPARDGSAQDPARDASLPARDAGRPRRPSPGAPTGLPEVERTELKAAERVLQRTGSWALPGVDGRPTTGVSVACDGASVWVLADGGLLLNIDLASGALTRTLMPSVSSGGGINLGGIELVGDEMWISTSGNQNALVMAEVASGKTVRTASSPSELGPTDLALGDEGVWLADGTGSVFLLDPETAAVRWQARLRYPERDYGIALRGDEVVIGNLFGGIWLHRRDDLSVIAELVDENGRRMPRERVGTMCFAGDDLVILNARGLERLSLQ